MNGYELSLDEAGQCSLSLDGEVLWSSDGDDDFTAEFDDVIESGDLNDVAAWLVQEGYIPPRTSIEIADASIDPGEESGWFETIDDPDADEDEDEEAAEEADEEEAS